MVISSVQWGCACHEQKQERELQAGSSFSHHLLIHLRWHVNTWNDVEATKQIIFNTWSNHNCSIKTSMTRNFKLMNSLLCSIAKFILLSFPTHQEIRCSLWMLGLCRSSQLSIGTRVLAGDIQLNAQVYYTHTVPMEYIHIWYDNLFDDDLIQ